MQKIFGQNDPRIAQYASDLFRPEDQTLAEIRQRAAESGLPPIHVGQMDGLHLEVLARMSGARKAVEIGTLAGYSGVSLLRGMGEGARLYTFEYEPKHAEVARESFKRADLAGQVELFVGPALSRLPEIERHGPFDLVFIDADKVNYPGYLAWAADHLRVGGVVLGDNTFAWGTIADDKFEDAEAEVAARALQRFNHEAARGGRFRATVLPTGEGLTVAVKVK
jgi:caffeoyl-CoA O-methyltransferase